MKLKDVMASNAAFIVVLALVFVSVFTTVFIAVVNYRAENTALESKLEFESYERIKADKVNDSYAYNAAEVLARMKMDERHGPGKYTFTSTNFNGHVWFKAFPR